jgi:hypothetical protein
MDCKELDALRLLPFSFISPAFERGCFRFAREGGRDPREIIFEVKRGVYPMRWLAIFEQKKKPTLASRLLGLS